MHSTIRILRSEHTALVALLRTAMSMMEKAREQAGRPDFEFLRAMLLYIAEFPERHHHRKESELLFPRLRARSPLARPLLDRLDDDHARGQARVRDLEHALAAFEVLGESRRVAFEAALERYVDFYLVHRSLEEREVFPLAERVLQPRDWEELDAEFAQGIDPLTGADPQEEYVGLFARIRPRLQSA